MVVDIKNLIAAISPDIYCDPSVKDKVKETIKAGGENNYLEAAKIAKLKDAEYMDIDGLYYKSPLDSPGIKAPIERHSVVYDAANENLEPVYFWLLDYLNNDYKKAKKVDKLIDNFVSSPGSSHFSEMGMKATKMQDEAMKLLGSANTVIKSILNILYDLKEFKIRLEVYKDLKSGDKAKMDAAMFSLKQVWLDTVDFKRGNTSIKQMAAQYQYVTLIDAFFAAKSLEDLKIFDSKAEEEKATEKGLKNIDINDRVKRILQQRLLEFYKWISESESELNKRFEIEKIYLRSQVNSVKLYSKWAKPYLKAAQDLEMRATPDGSLVNAFNTSLFELTLLAQGEYDLKGDVARHELPVMIEKAKSRKYWAVTVVELKFRSIPGRSGGQQYTFRGKLEANFTSVGLNDDELKILREQVEKDDLKDAFNLIGGATEESLSLLTKEIDEFLSEKKPEKDKEEKKEKSNDINPFSALFEGLFTGWFGDKEKNKEDKKQDLSKGIEKDTDIEKIIRSQSIIQARTECSKLYTSFKKAHGMVA